jgi:aminodeoxychorismate synthase, component I, bacterial clade
MLQPRLEEFPYPGDSESTFARLRHLPGAIWLDSGKPRSLQGRYDIISALPQVTLMQHSDQLRITGNIGDQHVDRVANGDPFNACWQLIEEMGLIDKSFAHLPFTGGLMGYFSYDLGNQLQGVSTGHQTRPDNPLPAMRLGWYGWALTVNHQSQKAWLIIHPSCSPEIVEQVLGKLRIDTHTENMKAEPESSVRDFKLTSAFTSTPNRELYRKKIATIQDYISAGDCYQVNYAIQHKANYSGDPWQAYKKLRRACPSPFSAYMQWDETAILSCSPERFLKVSVGQVETKPIKGTIARGSSLAEDQENAVQLQNSTKDRAENLMIVDLLRNDISRNCKTGTVRTPKLFALESFANVHHLVSTITGTLEEDKSPLDLLRDSFPGGSITGAPKKRAMEIIAELESAPRGLYCGSIGYISATGRMDTNIAIRTLVATQGEIACWGGGGIVADSDPQKEYEEAQQKVAVFLAALEAL